ncbi:glucosaminidase domain-containing protein [Staphylococcus borealis]|uniref:Glucosaminidase domain-containing protein n=1 Tax=Staphylococcus borealis TaxID=2742203 RepID=A0ABX2LSL8_9STAP|nr:glucosaminidase domain-containing protein [Staphylococcus borealis]NUI83539.1 glucosaminidase domain-containing protein [Staphylococcus borealis]NUI93560.1 glucosaminidase domain-containing protein [Staphylococcus borealis]
MAILPSSGKPTASQVAEWAKWLAKNRKGVDVDGRYGFQCWDLPNYIFNRYWSFRTWGNANAMARRDNYPSTAFKIYANTPNFVPKPGDIAVWTAGTYGHTNIVVGPCTKSYWYGVDQNWSPVSEYYGSRALLVKHSYSDGPGGVRYFVRPPYKSEPKKTTPPKDTGTKPTTPKPKPTETEEAKEVKTVLKDVKEIKFTVDDVETNYPTFIPHRIAQGKDRGRSPKKVLIRDAGTMCSVLDLYTTRRKYIRDAELPHYYIDRNYIWQPRYEQIEVPSAPDCLVIEVCRDYSDSQSDFILNEIHAMIYLVDRMKFHSIPMKKSSFIIKSEYWRTILEHGAWNTVSKGQPSKKVEDKTIETLINLYQNREKLLNDIPSDKVTKRKIKVEVPKDEETNPSSNDKPSNNTSTSKTKTTARKKEPTITVVYSKYTYNSALNIQMARAPQVNYGSGWYNASRSATSSAMNNATIWNNSKMRYQMLNLGKYQGIPVSKLNQILKGKGTLSGQGQAFADGCKKYNINEIYLIAHAFLESGYGTSNFASGRYGAYNYFGIGAYDYNPNYAMTLAKSYGWTTPAKAIIGGAKFVRQGYINKGQQTLYRMRWNPQSPGNHQYATDINWCKHQANTIYNLYSQIGMKGEYFLRDRYKS